MFVSNPLTLADNTFNVYTSFSVRVAISNDVSKVLKISYVLLIMFHSTVDLGTGYLLAGVDSLAGLERVEAVDNGESNVPLYYPDL